MSRARKHHFFVVRDAQGKVIREVAMISKTEAGRDEEERYLWCFVDDKAGQTWDVEVRKIKPTEEGNDGND